jgi:gas vesicle protein
MAEVDLLIKLFDTLKDASKETRDLCHAMLTNQNNIGNYIKNLPMTDLTQALKDHANQSTSEIGSCTETVESTTDTILNELKNLAEKIKTMIIVVSVAFSLFTLATLIGVISYNIRENTSLETKVEEYTTIQDGHDELKKEIIESIREEFRKK